jgi:chemotaxis protein methyltransferase CheR
MGGGMSTDDAIFAEVKAMVIARTGHHYYTDKDGQLRDHVVQRMAACGDAELSAYRDRLRDATNAEWPLIESAVTINETFFFRFAEQFDALRRDILPKLIERHRSDRRLRIWSVGCSTGAEAHSIAILLVDMLGDAIKDWRIALTGTDIDEAALTAARQADYSAWALRTLGEPERERLFDRDGARYRLKERYRTLARFERHNLMTMIDDAAPLHFTDYDLILCRNVLIYFSHDHATRIVGALAARLAEEGTLLLGHAEPNPDFDSLAIPTRIGGILTYRRPGTVGPTPHPEPFVALPPPPAPAVPPPRPVVRRSVPVAPPPRPAVTDATSRYLAGLGAMALGEREIAERGFRDALYLDRSFAMAHYLLGRHLLAQGRDVDGKRSLTNALRLAAALPAEAELTEGDGMTAGAMVAAVRHAIGASA